MLSNPAHLSVTIFAVAITSCFLDMAGAQAIFTIPVSSERAITKGKLGKPNTSKQESTASEVLEVYDFAVKTIEDNFFDSEAVGKSFQKQAKQIRERLASSTEQQSTLNLNGAVNELLSTLNTSHTYYLDSTQTEYYRIASVFKKLPHVAAMFPDGKVEYPSIGILPKLIDGRWYVENVLPNSSAESAGMRIGDIVTKVGSKAFTPIQSLKSHLGGSVLLTVERNGKEMQFDVTVTAKDPQEEFLQALKDSMRLEAVDGKKIGYAHFYSYAGPSYQDALIEAVSWGPLAEGDALVLDFRYGMGGANIAYLNMFQKNIPTMEMINREGQARALDQQWRKPAVIIIDGSARSGKETFAYGAKQLGLATLVGEPTAGAVVAGSPFPMPNGDLLYLAVADVKVDGKRLEGNPVQPDHLVSLDLKTCEGVDTPRETAIRIAAELAEDSTEE